MKRLLFLLLILPFAGFAQFHITGKVLNSADQKPVADASVFLSNASAGAKTNADGSFDIANVHTGNYEMVISIVGYETGRQNVMVNNDVKLPDIMLAEKNIQLKEVKIGPDGDWDRKYAMFKKQFFGTSDNARFCKILNPEVISLDFNKKKNELTGSSYDFIIIENKALGYTIKYLLNQFSVTYDSREGDYLYYEGSAFFEDMKGKESDIKRWQKNRQEAYLGSEMHFLRSVISNTVSGEGFVARRLIREPNPDYDVNSNKKYNETLSAAALVTNDYTRRTTQKGEYALVFADCLYITYAKKSGGDAAASVVIFRQPAIYFDDNGIIINPQSAVLEDTWGNNRMAGMLPVDYQPLAK